MTLYINTQTLVYPYTQDAIQQLYPDVSFPVPFVAPAPYAAVMQAPQPTYNPITQACVEGTPADLSGIWTQTWNVVNLTPEQIAYNEQQKATSNGQQAQQLLSATDWTSIPSVADPAQSNPYLMNQAAFLSWRSQIRAIAVNPTWDAVFPTQPTEQWSTPTTGA